MTRRLGWLDAAPLPRDLGPRAMQASVVITVYNLEKYVAEAVESALAQRGVGEVIVIDDASTDGSAATLARFGDAITVVRNASNLGVLRSTVVGVRRARCEVVCFLDGDDIWADGKVASVLERFAAEPAAVLVSHDYRFVDSRRHSLRENDPSQLVAKALLAAGDRAALSAAMRASILEYRGHVWLGSAFAIRRGALDLDAFAQWVEALEAPGLVYQDHPLATFLLLTSGGAASYIDRKLLDYRVHDESYSTGSVDLVRARRIITKGAATRQATLSLVERYAPLGAPERAIQRAKCVEYDFLRALYERDTAAAFRHYAACARDSWGRAQTAKEAVRLGAVLAVGPERFFLLKKWAGQARRKAAALA